MARYRPPKQGRKAFRQRRSSKGDTGFAVLALLWRVLRIFSRRR